MRACNDIFLKKCILFCVLAKPTLLFMQIILYCMTYNQPTQASCIELVEVICPAESPKDPFDDHMQRLGNLQLQNMPSQHCYVMYPQ